MGSSILHIKDSYYFEVPKAIARSNRESLEDFPEFWIRLDEDYQLWEAGRILDGLEASEGIDTSSMPSRDSLLSSYSDWRLDHKNFAKPFDAFLEKAEGQAWFQDQIGFDAKELSADSPEEKQAAVKQKQEAVDQVNSAWQEIRTESENVQQYLDTNPKWSSDKIEEYNHQLDGKILIPQPFGQLKNLYEKESGFAISKFMIIELVVALLVGACFIWLARRMASESKPRGKMRNMLEAILLYFRDEVARPAIGGKEADKFVPLLWTLFSFILGMNLMGMIPWVGAPTGAFGVTLGMAIVTLGTGMFFGMKKFGFLGYWKNQVPSMGLPWYMAIVIVPMIFLIEVLGLLIKHTVLGIRLLANMVAGHLVLLAVMGLAVAAAGSSMWGVTATISVVGSTLFSCLELFVAFLQAYVFTFLSALFIGMAIHHH